MNRIRMLKLATYPFRSLFGSGLGNIRLVKSLYKRYAVRLLDSQYVVVDIGGCKLGVTINEDRPLESLGASLILGNGYEIQMTKLFKSLVKEGMNVVDVGAFIGYYTVIASSLVGERGKVWAFEPEPGNIKELRNNVILNDTKNVILFSQAVSNKCGREQLFVSDGLSGECSLVDIKVRSTRMIGVDVVALDDVLGYEKVDIIKIDVDGGEMGVLSGARNLIRRNPQIKIFTELFKEGLDGAGYSYEDYWDSLVQCGFNFIYLMDEKEGLTQRVAFLDVVEYLQKLDGVNLLCSKDNVAIPFRGMIPKVVTKAMPKRVLKRIDVLCGLLKENDRVLDVGCGTGEYITNVLGYLPIHILAIDNDFKSIEYASDRNKHENVEFVLASGETFESKCIFDLIVCSHILEHIPNPLELLRNMHSLLKDDGILYVGLPNGYGCFEIENYIPRMVYKTRWGARIIDKMRVNNIKDSLNMSSWHVQHFTLDRTVQLLKQSGWKILRQANEELLGGVITDRTLLKIPLLSSLNEWIAEKLPAQLVNSWVFICKKES